MKKTLFTALALASGVFMQTSLAEEVPALQPPTTAYPSSIRLDMDEQGVVEEYTVDFTVPYGKLSKAKGFRDFKDVVAVDATGKRVKSGGLGSLSWGGASSVGLNCDFEGLSPDTPYLDIHAKLNLGTGDAVTSVGPVSLDVKKDKEITLGGTTFTVFFEPEEDGASELIFRAKGTAPELLSVTYDDEVTYMECDTSRSRGKKAKDVKYRDLLTLDDEAGSVVEVRSYTLTNPHNIQVPLDCRVSTEPLYKVEFRLPEDGGLQPPLPSWRRAVFRDSVQGWEETSIYKLRLVDEDLSFLPGRDNQVYCCGETDEHSAPSVDFTKYVDYPDFNCKKPHLECLKTMKVRVEVSCPDAYEGEVQSEHVISVEVAKLGKMRLFVLKADGQPHEIKHGEFTIRYTLAAQGTEDKDGRRDFEYSCEGPDGDSGVCLLHNASVWGIDYKVDTDSSTGTTIRRTSFKELVSKQTDKPIMLMLLPYTERRTITIPASVSGKTRNPFSSIPQE